MTPAQLINRVVHTLLPVDCTSCGEALWDDPIPFFCQPCWSQIASVQGPVCPRCSFPFPSPVALAHSPFHLCGPCRRRPPAYTKAWTLYAYKSPLREAISKFKYHGKVTLARPLADLMIAAFAHPPEIDCILPVPLHPLRLREREYNQSLLLADCLSRHYKVPVLCNVLLRTRHTLPQTGLNRAARLKNLRRSFTVTQPARITGKHLLLVDDVFTTGTTVNECAKTLRKAGAGEVYVETLARMV